MSAPYVPTEAELDLFDTARRILGINLSELLLAGLGEPHQPRRLYTTRSVRAHWPGLTFRFEAVSDSGGGLPGGRDPLVMSALLHLLWTGEKGRDKVSYRDEELLKRLAWPDIPESRRSIAEAVERYYCTVYLRRSMGSSGSGNVERRSSQVQKLVPGYETTVELLNDPPKGMQKSTIVQFAPKLIEEVTGSEKYFLGVDFARLLIERIMPGNAEASSESFID